MVVVNSTTKGLAAMTVAVANSRGWIDYEAPVAEYWPEFAQNGKGAVTVRQLLSHEAGLVWIDEPLRVEDMRDLDYVSRALARQKPAWEPGTRHGYHAMTIGLYMQELIRHVDPAHRTLGRFFARGDREAAGDRVLHRTAARDSRRAARAAEALLSHARHPSAAFGPQGVCDADPVAVVAAAKVDAVRGPRPERSPHRSRSRSRQATAWGRRGRSRGPTRRSRKEERSSASPRRRSRASRRSTTPSVRGTR